ncbi:BnaC01g28120D [Brassica napus]|uniref:BnaC01g28120D protein n=1 Tax=Brassica napus TaxID=3708 RepID=A0A078HJK6_BRANA|nr:BnaC01g28120D [Brassica napus]
MKSKFVVTPPANVTETLLKEIPVQYVVVKPGSSVNIEIPASETRDLFLSLIHEQGETKASEDDTQSSKVFVKLITGAK